MSPFEIYFLVYFITRIFLVIRMMQITIGFIQFIPSDWWQTVLLLYVPFVGEILLLGAVLFDLGERIDNYFFG